MEMMGGEGKPYWAESPVYAAEQVASVPSSKDQVTQMPAPKEMPT